MEIKDRYVSLNTHSSWSLGQALSTPEELFKKAEELGQRAVAITDFDTMSGIWDSLKASRKTGIKLIAGCEFHLVDDVTKENQKLYKIVLIAKNHTGYKNLLALRKYGSDNYIVFSKKVYTRIDWKLLEKHSEGLICLSGDGNGYIAQLIMTDSDPSAVAERFYSIFGDNFALQLMPNNLQIKANPYSGDVDQRKINIALKELHNKLPHLKCIVATGSYYLEPEHHEAQDVLLAISSGQPVRSGQRLRFDKNDFYVKSEEQVRAYFGRHKNLWPQEFVDSMFKNIEDFVDSCENSEWIDPKFSNPTGKELPIFPVKDQKDYKEFLEWKAFCSNSDLADDVLYYRYIVENGQKDKLESGILDLSKIDEYNARIAEELDVLEYHGFSSYMLIVWDMIRWCIENSVYVGPGRGSCSGSYTAYLIDIHRVNPFKYGTIFARFHNREKKSFPDIDVDIAPSGRDRLHKYINEKYGKDYVAHVSNISTITPKVYARDISRVFEFGDDGRTAAAAIGNDIADSIPNEYSRVSTALKQAPLFAEYAKQYPELAKFTILEKKQRAWATHAAGLIIGKRSLHEIVPIRKDQTGSLCLEYEKERAEENGLVKLDTLGLETLDIIKDTYKLIRSVGKTPPDEDFDYDKYDGDQKTYDMISKGDVQCVFQLTGVAAPVCRMLKPKNITDLAIITSLIRPAAKAIIPEFLKVRFGEKPLELLHPKLGRALNGTNGFGLFEECLMYIAADIPGWSLHKADDLRKMTKDKGKHPEKVEKLKTDFINDAVKNDVDKEISTKIWTDIIEDFGGYGFNLSHATSYSFITYHSAYLKAHYPLEFLLANLMAKVNSNSPKAKDEVIKIKQEIRSLGIKIIPPNINTSDLSYKIIDDKTLMTGLDSLRNVKEDSVKELKEKRPFKSFRDMMDRTNVKSPVIQALAATGALDEFGIDRELMFFYASDYRKKLRALKSSLDKQVQKKKITQEKADSEYESFEYPFPKNEKSWAPHEVFAIEEHFLGEGITGTFKDRFPKFFDKDIVNIKEKSNRIKYTSRSDDEKENKKANTHAFETIGIHGLKGVVVKVFEFKVKNEESKIFGQTMARLTFEDLFGNVVDMVAFPNSWQAAKDRVEKELSGGKGKIQPGVAIYFNGAFQWDNPTEYSIILGDILSYKEAPKIPKSLKSKAVKIPRKTKVKKEDIKLLNKEQLAEELEEEMVFEGNSSDDDEYDFS